MKQSVRYRVINGDIVYKSGEIEISQKDSASHNGFRYGRRDKSDVLYIPMISSLSPSLSVCGGYYSKLYPRDKHVLLWRILSRDIRGHLSGGTDLTISRLSRETIVSSNI